MLFMNEKSTSSSWYLILDRVLNGGADVTVKGSKTKECSPAVLTFQDIRERYINPPGRNLNLPFAIAETLDILLDHNPGSGIYYNKNLKNWLNEETGRFDGHYGDRITSEKYGWEDQFYRVYATLADDHSSRQATVTIHNPVFENYLGRDIACTMDWQFIIRDERLNMITHMRSNDIVLGFCYDTFTNQFMQEMLASWLDIEPGIYTHIVGSLHAYEERDKELIGRVFEADPWNNTDIYCKKPKSVFRLGYVETWKQLRILDELNQELIRKDEAGDEQVKFEWLNKAHDEISGLDPLIKDMARVLVAEHLRRRKLFDFYDSWKKTVSNEYADYFEQKDARREE
jgi:thymidylate synthase